MARFVLTLYRESTIYVTHNRNYMKQFQDLYLRFPDGRADEFFESLDASLPEGWRREREAEERASQISIGDRKCFYYACGKTAEREAAMVSIYRRDDQNYHVTNIVPLEERRLEEGQYNVILQDFRQRVLSMVHTDVPVSFLLGPDDLKLDDLMPPEVFRALKAFSSAANRSTGSGHRLDQERWFTFIIGLHRSGKAEDLDAETLERWLIETERWPAQWAGKLGIEYEQAISLLNYAARY